MTDQVLCCPVCQSTFIKEGKQFKCFNNHSFDCAKEGYVNLLLSNKKSSKDPGDSKEMMIARQRFLSNGYYEHLSDTINETLAQNLNISQENIQIFDAGSGEGYYIDRVQNYFQKNNQMHFTGIDISKEGVRLSAKRNKNIQFAVASVFELPIENQSIDAIISVFAPLAEVEFNRIIKDNGILVVVSPGAHHLYGLKERLYENPYLNEEDKVNFEYFKLISKQKVNYDIEICGRDDLHALMMMTPYYWKTSQNQMEHLLQTVQTLTTTIEFVISVYHKK